MQKMHKQYNQSNIYEKAIADVSYGLFISRQIHFFSQHFSDLVHKINYPGYNESSKHCNTQPFSFKKQKKVKNNRIVKANAALKNVNNVWND